MVWPNKSVRKGKLTSQRKSSEGQDKLPVLGRQVRCLWYYAARNSGEVWPCVLSYLSPTQNPPLVSHLTRGKCQTPHKALQDLTTRSQVQEYIHTRTHTHTPHLLQSQLPLSLFFYPPAAPAFPECTKTMPISNSALLIPSLLSIFLIRCIFLLWTPCSIYLFLLKSVCPH